MAPTVEKLPIPKLGIGEGPHWDIETKSLYLIDVVAVAILRYDPENNKTYTAKLDIGAVNFIIPVAGSKGKFIIGSGHKLYIIVWDGVSEKIDSLELIHELTDALECNGINDASCDASGRLWFGTLDRNCLLKGSDITPTGKLYSYTKAEGCRVHDSGYFLSNGIAWDSEGKKMYFSDTYAYSIFGFDCISEGKIGNRKVVFNLKDNDIKAPLPDGITIDKDGKLWIALFGNSEVLRIDPETGKLLERVPIPAAEVTSVAWGGPNLEHLYVTTGNIHPEGGLPLLPKTILVSGPDDGCTFRISGLSTSGLPMLPFKL